MHRVLVIDDEPSLRRSLGRLLQEAGYEVAAEGDGRAGLERALAEPFDLILCDIRMPELDGLAFLRAYRGRGGAALVLMMSAFGGEDDAIAAMKEGAYDYIRKPFRADEVVLSLRKAEEREGLRHTVARLKAQLDSGQVTRALVAESAPMRKALEVIGRVAELNTTVLITGESGTGKEVVARAIHRASPRAAGAFVGINCAAIPETLLESELFGSVRGAFTGATGDKMGLFEQAHGGTLLLDEIGELPLGLQAKLLRVLEEREIRRVGDRTARKVDVRVLAATAKHLEAEVAAARFREDLFYRLNVVCIHLPPLRDRPEDIAPLARHSLDQLSRRILRPLTLSPAALAWLERQPWRGNVRELEHAIERAAVLSGHQLLDAADFEQHPFTPSLPAAAPAAAADAPFGPVPNLRDAVEASERQTIAAALQASSGNRREAARRLGVSVRTLFYKMERYRLE